MSLMTSGEKIWLWPRMFDLLFVVSSAMADPLPQRTSLRSDGSRLS